MTSCDAKVGDLPELSTCWCGAEPILVRAGGVTRIRCDGVKGRGGCGAAVESRFGMQDAWRQWERHKGACAA